MTSLAATAAPISSSWDSVTTWPSPRRYDWVIGGAGGDRVGCGRGFDLASVEGPDELRGCEAVRRR